MKMLKLFYLLLILDNTVFARHRNLDNDPKTGYNNSDFPPTRREFRNPFRTVFQNDRIHFDSKTGTKSNRVERDRQELTKLFENILQFKNIIIEKDVSNTHDYLSDDTKSNIVNYRYMMNRNHRQEQPPESAGYTHETNTCKQYNDNLDKIWQTMSKYVRNAHNHTLSKMDLHNVALMTEAYLEHKKPIRLANKETLRGKKDTSETAKLMVSLIEEVISEHGDAINSTFISDIILKYLKPIVKTKHSKYCSQANEDKLTTYIEFAYKKYLNSKCSDEIKEKIEGKLLTRGRENSYQPDNSNKTQDISEESDTNMSNTTKIMRATNHDIITATDGLNYINEKVPINHIQFNVKENDLNQQNKLKLESYSPYNANAAVNCEKSIISNFLHVLETIVDRYLKNTNCVSLNSLRSGNEVIKMNTENYFNKIIKYDRLGNEQKTNFEGVVTNENLHTLCKELEFNDYISSQSDINSKDSYNTFGISDHEWVSQVNRKSNRSKTIEYNLDIEYKDSKSKIKKYASYDQHQYSNKKTEKDINVFTDYTVTKQTGNGDGAKSEPDSKKKNKFKENAYIKIVHAGDESKQKLFQENTFDKNLLHNRHKSNRINNRPKSDNEKSKPSNENLKVVKWVKSVADSNIVNPFQVLIKKDESVTSPDFINLVTLDGVKEQTMKTILDKDLDKLFNQSLLSLSQLTEKSVVMLPSILNNVDKSFVEITYALRHQKIIVYHPLLIVKQTIPYDQYSKQNFASKHSDQMEIIKAVSFSPHSADVKILYDSKNAEAIKIYDFKELELTNKIVTTSDTSEIKSSLKDRLDNIVGYNDFNHNFNEEKDKTINNHDKSHFETHSKNSKTQIYTDPRDINMFKVAYSYKHQKPEEELHKSYSRYESSD